LDISKIIRIFVLMKKFTFKKGRKKEGDLIMFYNNLPVKFSDVAKMCIFFMENEDNLYPPSEGYKGAEYFKEYIMETLKTRKVPSEKKYQTNKELTKV